jgi:hypothetical protein
MRFGSGIETRVFFSGEKKVNHYENESTIAQFITYASVTDAS